MNNIYAIYVYESKTLKPVIARSYCEVKFSSEDQLLQCVEALKESDQKMSLRAEEKITYEWDSGHKIGNILQFGVKWYDQDFFAQEKDIYKNSMHEHLFEKFGAKIVDFEVKHFLLAA